MRRRRAGIAAEAAVEEAPPSLHCAQNGRRILILPRFRRLWSTVLERRTTRPTRTAAKARLRRPKKHEDDPTAIAATDCGAADGFCAIPARDSFG
uniref:Uncharacterized protein n=1 Tax=Plectus sambesii TaxID=2011161 RepID=A0A914XMZ3_9BILA